jgi:hypothetical protein
MDFLNIPKGTVSSYTGVLYFQPIASESKQEHMGPVLHTSDGLVRVYIKGDNPFENSQFRSFENQNIAVEGKWKHGILVIRLENIKILHIESNPPKDQ